MVTALAMTLRSARRLAGSVGWRRLTIGAVLIGLAPAITQVHRSIQPSIGPLTVGDAVLLLGYGFVIGGLRWVLTARTMAFQVRSVLDSMLLTLWIGFGILVWLGPQLTDRLTGYPLLASLIYLPFSLAIIYLFLQLILGSASRSPSVAFLATTTALTVVAEFSFLAAAAGHIWTRRFGVATATLGVVVLAAAIRHPSARELETPVPEQAERPTAARLAGLVLSLTVVSLALVRVTPDQPYLAVLLVAIGVATMANLRLTIRSRERMLDVERQLRQSVADLMRADTPEQILELGGFAVDRVLAGKRSAYGEFVRHIDDQWLTMPDCEEIRASGAERGAITEAFVSWNTVRSEHRASEPGDGYVTSLVVPLSGVSQHADLLIVEASPVLTTGEIEQIEQVTAIVERALLANDLQEEAHRRRADQRFRALVHDSGDVVMLVDPFSEEIRMVSPSLERILGWDEREVIGRPTLDWFGDEDRPAAADLLRNVGTKPKPAPLDLRARHADGRYHWFAVTVRDHTADGEVGGLVVNLTDIQARKMAEMSLASSEHRYRALVDNSSDVFAVLDPDLTMTFVSPNVEAMLGHPAADLVATGLPALLTDEAAVRLGAFIANARNTMHNDVVELELRTKGGHRRLAEVALSDWHEGAERGLMLTIRDVTERRRLEDDLRDQAIHDQLTGLANRSTLHHDLQTRLQQLGPQQHLGLVHLGLMDFKSINQSLGYEAGDELLVAVATRLRASLRSSDHLARIGGDEFAIALTSEDSDEVLALARRALNLFDEPFEVAGRPYRVAVAMGVAMTDDRNTVAQQLLEQTSLAVDAAHRDQHRALRVFEPEMQTTATERFELEADLPGAIAGHELSVVYQPLVEFASREVRGVEALLRWSHPERGPISPAVFIPLAERSGLVVELGQWVMSEACAQLRRWHDEVPGADGLQVSVNVSAIQLERPGEAERLAGIVVDSGIDPSLVTVELTESTMIEGDSVRHQLQPLRDLGIKVAIDDFGTGWSGLNRLREMPFDVIKLDKAYVSAVTESAEARTLVKAVIELAHELRAETVAEGIETPAEYDLLQSLGCELGQGFYLARPMEGPQLATWFAKGRTGAVPALISRPAG